MLLLRLAEGRGAVVTPELLPGARHDRAWWHEIAAGLAVEDPGPDELPWWLAQLHAAVLEGQERELRRRGGSFYTPPALVDHLLDHAVEPTLDEAPDAARVSVLDPSCGPGLFLVAAVRRIARRGVPLERAVQQVHGTDLDPGALELARVALWLELLVPGEPLRLPALQVRCADALRDPPPRVPVDVVVGNPPFLTQLQRRTAAPTALTRLRADGVPVGPYTDLSAVFLHRSLGWVRDGGRVALVQPQSLLAARDAAGVRRHLTATGALEHLWASDVPVFDAHVLTCAPVVRRGGEQGAVTLSHGPSFEPVGSCGDPVLSEEWAFLLAPGLGLPAVRLRSAGAVGDVATCTADFRDQYYGLASLVHEHADRPNGVPLVTTGLVEPAQCLWGRRPARFQKRRWQAPVVDLTAVEDGPLVRWARARLVPKVLVGTQGRVIEAVVDEHGAWLPSVPTITVVPRPERLWHLLAVLLAPPLTAHAAATYAGTALSMRAVKLSARQVARLPLPADADAWDRGAAAVRSAQVDDARRAEHLRAMGEAMCAAYGVEGEEVLRWWVERVGLAG